MASSPAARRAQAGEERRAFLARALQLLLDAAFPDDARLAGALLAVEAARVGGSGGDAGQGAGPGAAQRPDWGRAAAAAQQLLAARRGSLALWGAFAGLQAAAGQLKARASRAGARPALCTSAPRRCCAAQALLLLHYIRTAFRPDRTPHPRRSSSTQTTSAGMTPSIHTSSAGMVVVCRALAAWTLPCMHRDPADPDSLVQHFTALACVQQAARRVYDTALAAVSADAAARGRHAAPLALAAAEAELGCPPGECFAAIDPAQTAASGAPAAGQAAAGEARALHLLAWLGSGGPFERARPGAGGGPPALPDAARCAAALPQQDADVGAKAKQARLWPRSACAPPAPPAFCWASSLTRRRLVHTDHREATVHVASVRSLTVRDGQVPAASWASAL